MTEAGINHDRPPDSAELLPGLYSRPSPGFLPLAEQPLLVLVGVTGVGKSSALAALGGLKLLPDRRELTDAVVITPLAGGPVTDREARFALTARYRRDHPGGMAQALASLHADPVRWGGGLVFDGLRGADEVSYAASHGPAWRFVSLHAPDALRVRRLLGRADAFDQVAAAQIREVQGQAGPQGGDLQAALEALPGVREVFGPQELEGLAALAGQGFSPPEIVAKTRIVLSERRNYDPQAARRILSGLPGWRQLDLDTAQLSPAGVAGRVTEWLGLRP